MRIVAFYTKNTPYEEEIKNLESSINNLGLTYHLEEYEGQGSWVLNCGLKSTFIWEMLHKFPDEDLLYVDADAIIHKRPQASVMQGDICAHVCEGGELLSGTIFFKNNERTKKLVREWITKQKKDPNKWDQKTLQEVIAVHGPRIGIIFKELPPTYTKIFDQDWGEPVIEHHQASRKHREAVAMSNISGVPSSYANMRITTHVDGTFTIPRRNREVMQFLDENFQRVGGNELRWKKRSFPDLGLKNLAPIFDGKNVCIVGKGPSLDNLSEEFFNEDDVIICLNESIHKVESLKLTNTIFMLQQDMGLRDTCKPKKASILVSIHAQHWYSEYKNKYVYNPREMNLVGSQLAAICAITISKDLGAKSFKMMCFDACVNKETTYADCIGHPSTTGGDPARFLKHRKFLDRRLSGYKSEWIIPAAVQSEASSCTPEHKSHNQQERCEHSHEESQMSKRDSEDLLF